MNFIFPKSANEELANKCELRTEDYCFNSTSIIPWFNELSLFCYHLFFKKTVSWCFLSNMFTKPCLYSRSVVLTVAVKLQKGFQIMYQITQSCFYKIDTFTQRCAVLIVFHNRFKRINFIPYLSQPIIHPKTEFGWRVVIDSTVLGQPPPYNLDTLARLIRNAFFFFENVEELLLPRYSRMEKMIPT